ncbi:FecR family protein [Nitrosomonas aestuarii]|uniref:FecR family protein n=1 Tax=Nitrosomonas aestuarii TaxID=52441 RepID=A0A1I3X1D6_9PROT|nr:FecR domain-containing protein [Nitrosomonas aestuarii]SFK13485.1 FecR family protein [Nitrosomonas aestuarii]
MPWLATRKTDRWISTVATAFLLILAHFFFTRIAHAVEACIVTAAQVVSVQGTVELRRKQKTIWSPVKIDTQLCAGDRIRVRNHSRAALRLMNDSMLRLNQKTTIIFPETKENRATSLMDLINGAMHIITRTPKPFEVKTPFMNAGVEGTEFFVGVDALRTQLVVYEGSVSAANDFGNLTLKSREAATAYKNQPPRKEFIINPVDAVQWALYYPAIIDYWPKPNTELDTNNMHAEIVLAARLLTLGNVDEAETAITNVVAVDPNNSDAYALQTVIALTQNDKDTALEMALRAVELNQTSAAAKLALSYVQQAYFKLEAALASVQQAAELDPQNALIWARIAELQMSNNALDLALNAAKKAVRLNPAVVRTQTVLGFAYLAKIKTKKAHRIFSKAIRLGQADPMPRLGLGLTLIRSGQLEAGRIELEIAASLDPGNSLIRSYLGKAYFEEKRYSLSSTQFDMAKDRDLNDPTPWFYDAIQKQTQNRPVEALRDIQKSIKLNNNRAVYRSRLLLDQDEAARGSSLSRIYDNLGFEKRAIMQTAQSLSIDPSNHSAHRFLSDIYVNIPRHEIARVSELLQAQLLQPINTNPVQPQLAVADLNIITNTGPTAVGFNEFAPLMERDRSQLVTSGIAGSHNTFGNEIVYSRLYDKTSVSLGQFHHQSDGFRRNNDQNHDVLNAFIQHAFTPRLNIQGEVRTRETEHGDLLLDFDRDRFDPSSRRYIHEDVARMGARYELSPNQDFIVSGKYIDRNEKLNSSSAYNTGFQFEGQHMWRHAHLNTVFGGGIYQFDRTLQIINRPKLSKDLTRENVYLYTNLHYFNNLDITLGVGYDAFNSTTENIKENKINPKFGFQWSLRNNLRIRGALFETSKSHLVAQQTLEPTQIAGFNQFFDDINGTRTRRMGLGLDVHLSHILYGGVEASKRILHVPLFLSSNSFLQKQSERLYRSYLYWTPHKYVAIKGEFQFEQFKRNPDDQSLTNIAEPTHIKTLKAPISLEYFHPSGFFSGVTGTFVKQNLTRLSDFGKEQKRNPETTKSGIDTFFLLDAFLGLRFANRRGILSLEGRNLFDTTFYYRNINFYQSEAISPQFIPDRTIFARLTLNF